jgi:hypothetical protein
VDLPSEDSLRWLVGRYASLLAAHGEGIGSPQLVQPTAEDFPDAFEVSGPGVARFLARMLEYAPVASGLDVRLRITQDEADDPSCGTGGCGTSSCSDGKAANKASARGPRLRDRVIDADEAYLVEIPARDVGHPVRLATSLARSVGTVVLLEAGEDVELTDVGAMSEIAATASGFGVLLLAGSHIFGKSCGGVSIGQQTHLSVEEHGVLLALFTRLHGLKPSHARAHLEVTQVEAFNEALEWVDSNPALVSDLEARPEVLADGVFKMEPVKGLLGRWFSGSKAVKDPAEMAPVSRKAPRSAEEQRRLDEARALVDAALGED